jgi:hypothetical protein
MKLHEIPENSKIYIKADDGSTYITFHHLDGMYSYCETEKGAPVHLRANAELVKHKDGFKIKEEQ